MTSTKTHSLLYLVECRLEEGATLFTFELASYQGTRFGHEHVSQPIGKWFNGATYIQGTEWFWYIFKRAFKGTFHHLGYEHLQMHVNEFSGKHNIGEIE